MLFGLVVTFWMPADPRSGPPIIESVPGIAPADHERFHTVPSADPCRDSRIPVRLDAALFGAHPLTLDQRGFP